MGKRSSRQEVAYLPLVLCATFLVMVCPVILVWWLRDSGVVTSVWAGIGIGVAASFGASYVGAALWKTRTGSRDILFGELMVWGWVQRWRAERCLATATDVLGLRSGPRRSVSGGRLTHEEQAGLLTQLASALEARDPYTHGHSRRVARHAANIAKRMGLPPAEIAKIRTAGVIHDVGKVKIPTAVLHKEGKLTDGEFEVVKSHPVEGATMISALGDHELTAIVRHHHERLDGTGYPDRLAGDAIPLGARIIAVADTFDAITSTRPYRSAHAHKKAIDILRAEAGAQLDPDAVRAFCSHYTGRRALALWAILANGPARLALRAGGGLSSAKAASVASVATTAATAAATAAVAGAAFGPLVDTPAHSPRAGEAATAPGVALAARQRPLPTPVAGDRGARPVNRRSQGKGDRLAAMTAPGARRAYRKRAGHETTPSGRARNPLKSVGQAATSAPIAAPGHDKRPAPKRATTPTRAPGHSKSHRGHPPGQQAKRPGPRRATTPNTSKRTPAGGKNLAGGKGPAESPGAPSPASSPTRSPLQKVLDDAHRLIPRPRQPQQARGATPHQAEGR